MANIKLTVREKEFIQGIKAASGAVGEFAARLSVDLTRSYNQADTAQRQFRSGLVRQANEIKSLGYEMSVLSAGLLGLAAASLNAYSDLGAMEKGLEAIEGGSDAASAALVRIKRIAKEPGLGLEEAAQAYTNLRAIGFEGARAEQTLIQFGNALALSGKGKAELGIVLTQVTQMASKSKVLAEDLKPILSAVPSIAKILKDEFGSVDSEEVSKKLQSVGMSTGDFVDFLVVKMGELNRVSGTLKNSKENFLDATQISLANLGETINNVTGFQNLLDSLGESMVAVSEEFNNASPFVQAFVVTIGGILTATGPVLIGLGALAKGVIPLLTSGFQAFLGPAGIALGILTALGVAAAVYISHTKSVKDFAEATMTSAQASTIAAAKTKVQVDEVNRLVGVLKNEKSSQDDVNKAKARLIEINPKFSEALKGQKIDFDKLTSSTKQFTEQIQLAAKAQVLYAALQKNIELQQQEELDMGSTISTFEKLKMAGQAFLSGGVQKGFGDYFAEIVRASQIAKEDLKFAGDNIAKELAGINTKIESETKKTPDLSGIVTTGKKIEEKVKKNLTVKAKPIPLDATFWEAYVNALTPPNTVLDKFGVSLQKLNAKIAADRDRAIEEIGLENQLATKIVGAGLDIGTSFAENLISGLMSGGGLGQAFSTMLSQVGDFMIRLGKEYIKVDNLIKAVKATLGTTLGPAAIAALIGGGVLLKGIAASGAFSGPKFADGGIVSGPTIGMVGEYAGASNNPEVIAPLDKLKGMLNTGESAQPYILKTSVSGDELFVMLERVKRKRNG